MNVKNVFDIAGAIVLLAIVTILVSRPNTARIIRAIGAAFAGSIRTAMGNA